MVEVHPSHKTYFPLCWNSFQNPIKSTFIHGLGASNTTLGSFIRHIFCLPASSADLPHLLVFIIHVQGQPLRARAPSRRLSPPRVKTLSKHRPRQQTHKTTCLEWGGRLSRLESTYTLTHWVTYFLSLFSYIFYWFPPKSVSNMGRWAVLL